MSSPIRKPDGDGTERLCALAAMNTGWLEQMLAILETMEDSVYASAPVHMPQHTVGGHLRHVIEFYECFLNGLPESHIDYDSRRREAVLERSRTAALTRLRSLIERLAATPMHFRDSLVFVRIEDARSLGLKDQFAVSSVSRELSVLSSHTIHHFALIAVTLQGHGMTVDPDLGVAPSTRRFRLECPIARPGEAA